MQYIAFGTIHLKKHSLILSPSQDTISEHERWYEPLTRQDDVLG